jgi:hypothetical protein
MLKNRSATTPELEKFVRDIVHEDAKYVLTEMRSMHRENLVVPVTLVYKDGKRQNGFSRNISPVGICLISQVPVAQNQMLDLEIYRLSGKPSTISAEVRWCKPFGEDFFMSGWKFVRMLRR